MTKLIRASAGVLLLLGSGCESPPASCTGSQTECGSQCVEPTTDHQNCGACGTACAAGEVCTAGKCAVSCVGGATVCSVTGADGGATPICANLETDPLHCGSCGSTCASIEACVQGSCRSNCGTSSTPCGLDGGSPYCAALGSDNANCGVCGQACPAIEICNGHGVCGPACAAGALLCGSLCADVQTDPNNCGACAAVCPSGQACVAGECAETCPSGDTACGGSAPYCANLQNDTNNCGACGTVCAGGEVCVGGGCQETCGAGYTACTSASGPAYCANLKTDPTDCGKCGGACAGGQDCVSGQCVATCAAGYTTCTSANGDSYCANLDADNDHCGACDTACPGGTVCSQGGCHDACGADYALCSGAADAGSDGGGAPFCANLLSDSNNCGGCGLTCPAGEDCVSGQCACASPGRPDLCGQGAASFCTNAQFDPGNCGACGIVCENGACAGGVCRCLAALDAGSEGDFNLCSDGANFICVDSQSDPGNCGGCGIRCEGGGQCQYGSCQCPAVVITAFVPADAGSDQDAGQDGGGDAGVDNPDLCPLNTNYICTNEESDPNNCGTCGVVCTNGVCTNGQCACSGTNIDAQCPSATGFVCTNLLTDSSNCSACGVSCGAGTCVGGSCTCPASSTMCDTPTGSTCTNPLKDPANCGACGVTCDEGHGLCSAGTCQCSSSFAPNLCPATPGFVCSDFQTDSNNCGQCGHVCSPGQACESGACVTNLGCSDGTREGFTDPTQYPTIAACSGGWTIRGIMAQDPGFAPSCPQLQTFDTVDPACNRNSGNSSTNPDGTGCNVADLCAPGWHVCNTAYDVQASSPTGCDGSTDASGDQVFFIARQSSDGCNVCALGTSTNRDCNAASCEEGCLQTASLSNDVYGCGSMGNPITSCNALNEASGNLCGNLGGTWSCSVGQADSNGECEGYTVLHGDSNNGGVVCCADSVCIPASLTLESDANTQAVATTSLSSGDIFGLDFEPAVVGAFGSSVAVPPHAPSTALVVNIPPGGAQSGYFMDLFTLPSGIASITITGVANVDSSGAVFLNGTAITPAAGQPGALDAAGNVSFTATGPFLAGVNSLVILDDSANGTSGAAFFATVTYTCQ